MLSGYDRLKAEWPVIRQAPLTLGLVAALAIIGTFSVVSWFSGQQIKVRDDRIASLEQTLIEARKEKGDVQGQLDELRQQTQGWNIKKEDRGEFIRALSAEGPQIVKVGHIEGDFRGQAFVWSLMDLFRAAGWGIESISRITPNKKPQSGVTIWIEQGREIPRAASILQSLLEDQGIEVRIERNYPPENSPASFFILVGPKS